MNNFILKFIFVLLGIIIIYFFDSLISFNYWFYVYLFFIELLFLIYRFRNNTIIIVLLLFSSLWGLEFIISDLLGWGISSVLFEDFIVIFYCSYFFVSIDSLS